LVAAVGLTLAAGACGGPAERFGTSGDEVATIDGDRTYVRALSVYSFRRDDLLQATLQVGELGDDADYTNQRFRLGLVSQVGRTQPREVRVADQPVWMTTGTNQQLTIWFKGRRFFVLAQRAGYEQPRRLQRTILELGL
jgi:hypothetical protein